MKVKELKKAIESGRMNDAFGIQETVGDDGLVKSFHIDPQIIPDLQQTTPRKFMRDLGLYESEIGAHLCDQSNVGRTMIQETGGAVTASSMSPINAFTAMTAGLFGAQVKAEWQLLQPIYSKFCHETTATVMGGHKIPLAAAVVKPANKPLAEGEKAPMIGAAPFWLWTQKMEVRQHGIQMTLESMLADVNGTTSELQNNAKTLAYELQYQQNKRALQLKMGRTNTYCVNNDTNNEPNANTYQTTVGTGIMNYVNAGTSDLTTLDVLNAAYYTLAANKHPINPHWRLGFDKTLQLWVHPKKVMNVMKLVRQIQAMTSSIALSTTTEINISSNPLVLAGYNIEVEDYTYYGEDVLTAAGTNYDGSAIDAMETSDAEKCWFFNVNRQFMRHEIMQALQTRSLPLTGDDLLHRIVFKADGLLIDNFVMEEPRYCYFGAYPSEE